MRIRPVAEKFKFEKVRHEVQKSQRENSKPFSGCIGCAFFRWAEHVQPCKLTPENRQIVGSCGANRKDDVIFKRLDK